MAPLQLSAIFPNVHIFRSDRHEIYFRFFHVYVSKHKVYDGRMCNRDTYMYVYVYMFVVSFEISLNSLVKSDKFVGLPIRE